MIPEKLASYVDPASVALGFLLSGLLQLVVALFLGGANQPAAAIAVAVVGLSMTTLAAGMYAVHLHAPNEETTR